MNPSKAKRRANKHKHRDQAARRKLSVEIGCGKTSGTAGVAGIDAGASCSQARIAG